mmetsp:Transcript_41567/g.101987  ORF Transcript_41567/g.101987 Transcript_41567/m.101987 type:complete len:135 (-) Transcript_41567:153-557(-)
MPLWPLQVVPRLEASAKGSGPWGLGGVFGGRVGQDQGPRGEVFDKGLQSQSFKAVASIPTTLTRHLSFKSIDTQSEPGSRSGARGAGGAFGRTESGHSTRTVGTSSSAGGGACAFKTIGTGHNIPPPSPPQAPR